MKERVLFGFFMLVICLNSVSSLETGYCANAVLGEITPNLVEPNEDFLFNVQIDNCGEKISSKSIFEITRISSGVIVKEPLLTNLGQIYYANTKRFINYHLRTNPDIVSGAHYIEARLIYGDDFESYSKNYTFEFNVKSDNSDLALSGVKTTPEKLIEGEDMILTIKVQNTGKGDAKAVRVQLENSPFEGVSETYIGEIKSGEELPARFVLRASKAGVSTITARVFANSAGQSVMKESPIQIQVSAKDNKLYLVTSVISLVLLIVVFLLFRKNN